MLCQKAKTLVYEADQIIFMEGEDGGAMYFIDEGEVSVESTIESDDGYDTVIYAIRRKDEVIGELALFDQLERSATARTLAPSKLLRLRGH